MFTCLDPPMWQVMKYESGAAEVDHRCTANRSVSFKRNVSKHAFSVSSLGASTLESDLCVYKNSGNALKRDIGRVLFERSALRWNIIVSHLGAVRWNITLSDLSANTLKCDLMDTYNFFKR